MFDDIIDRSRLASKVRWFAGKLVDGDWDKMMAWGSDNDRATFDNSRRCRICS
jgi:hypothetical protein